MCITSTILIIQWMNLSLQIYMTIFLQFDILNFLSNFIRNFKASQYKHIKRLILTVLLACFSVLFSMFFFFLNKRVLIITQSTLQNILLLTSLFQLTCALVCARTYVFSFLIKVVLNIISHLLCELARV